MNNYFWSIIFSKEDSISVFLWKLERLFSIMNLDKINNIKELSIVINIVNDIFEYIKIKKNELLLLEWQELMNLKINFRGIQKLAENMCTNSLFIDKLLRSDSSTDEIVVMNILDDFRNSFELPYYSIIQPSNIELPDRLQAIDTITTLRKWDWIKDNNTFNSMVWKIRSMCTFIVDEDDNLSELNLDQLKEVKLNVELLVNEINKILDKKIVTGGKVLSLKKVVDPRLSNINNIKSKLEQTIWKKERDIFWEKDLTNPSPKNTKTMINLLPKDSSEELSKDRDKFNLFINEFRRVSDYILLNKDKIDLFSEKEFDEIKKLLLDLFSKINSTLRKAKKKNNKQVVYNAWFLLKWKLS